MQTTTSTEHLPDSILDTVLTLRGHQVTLRQAMAEKLLTTFYDPSTGRVDITNVDERLIEKANYKRF